MAMRMVTIEAPIGNMLHAQVEANLVDKFVKKATEKRGLFRGRDESFEHALESAVTEAFAKFIEA